jgi:hypothetical protein
MRTKTAWPLAGVLALLAAPAVRGAEPPADWLGGGEGYERSLDTNEKHGGKSSGLLRSTGDDAGPFGTFLQAVLADKYRGKRLRLSAFVKSEDVADWAGLWMRVDGKEKTTLAFDNMMNRPVKGTTPWTRYEIVLDVPDDAHSVYFGLLAAGKGKVWVDDMAIEVVDKDVALTGLDVMPMDRQGDPPQGLPEAPKNLDFER